MDQDDVSPKNVPQEIDSSQFSIEALNKREKKVHSGFWKKFKRVMAKLPFAKDLVTAYYCAMDPDTPSSVRYVLLGALVYFIMPIDTIPDFIAGFGYGDDAAVLALAISSVQSHILPRHRKAAEEAIEEHS